MLRFWQWRHNLLFTPIRSLYVHVVRWPYSIPPDLRPRLDQVLSKRNVGAPEVWGEVRDWLEATGVEVPDAITVAPPTEGAQRDQ
jgi:hypothetical protein